MILKHREYEVGVPDWDIPAIDALKEEIDQTIRRTVSEILASTLADDDTYVYFPIEWAAIGEDGIGGKVPDPLTVYLRVSMPGEETLESPTYEFNLRDVLREDIKECSAGGSYSIGLGMLSAALRDLASEIDAARAKAIAGGYAEEVDAQCSTPT